MKNPTESLDNIRKKFDFINDEQFRESLVSDYYEVIQAIESSSWKAVHVLSGSIVEAVLIDYLCATQAKATTKKDPLKMDLGEAVAACKADGILSDRASELSSVVRGFRNLIHPGRLIRLDEKVDANTSVVAKALIDIVIDEVAAGKAAKWGLTAEQLVTKVQNDSYSISVLPHILRDTNEFERVRCLIKVLPEKYFSILDDDNDPDFDLALPRLRECFHVTFNTLNHEGRTKVANQFIKVLKEESGDRVLKYQRAFFRAPHLKYMKPSDAQYAKDHLRVRIASDTGLDVLELVDGLGEFLVEQEVTGWVNALMKWIAYNSDKKMKLAARDKISAIFWGLRDDEAREKLRERITAWIKFLEEKGKQEEVDITKELIDVYFSEDIPF